MIALSGVRSSWLMLARNDGFGRARRLGLFLGPAQFRLGLDHRGDVAPGTAIADEHAGLVEHRHAIDADMLHLAVGAGRGKAEVTKRPAGQQVALWLAHCSGAWLGVVHLPSALAEDATGRPRPIGRRPETDRDEAQLRILLPEPIGCHFGEIAQPRLARRAAAPAPRRPCRISAASLACSSRSFTSRSVRRRISTTSNVIRPSSISVAMTPIVSINLACAAAGAQDFAQVEARPRRAAG